MYRIYLVCPGGNVKAGRVVPVSLSFHGNLELFSSVDAPGFNKLHRLNKLPDGSDPVSGLKLPEGQRVENFTMPLFENRNMEFSLFNTDRGGMQKRP